MITESALIHLMNWIITDLIIYAAFMALIIGVYQGFGGKFYFRCWFIEFAIGDGVNLVIGRSK
jgi:hypothetical protein